MALGSLIQLAKVTLGKRGMGVMDVQGLLVDPGTGLPRLRLGLVMPVGAGRSLQEALPNKPLGLKTTEIRAQGKLGN